MDTFVMFLVLLCNVFRASFSEFQQDEQRGRIPEFDKILLKNSKNIAKATNIDSITKKFNRAEQNLEAEHEEEYVAYYYAVCEGMKENGEDYIIQEREKLHNILRGAEPKTSKGKKDIEYAYVRRNIVNAFVDASAKHVMESMNLDHPFDVQNPNDFELDLNNPDRFLNEAEKSFRYSKFAQSEEGLKAHKSGKTRNKRKK